MSAEQPGTGSRRAARFGKYEVVAHVATGGMGAVYRARDTENGREVALKVLTPEFAARDVMVKRFRREAEHAAKLRHDNIVTVHEFGEACGTLFIAMEFVDGIDLHEYIGRKGPLDPEEARQIVVQACRALRHVHAQGVVHRDIKPSNFLVTRKDGRPHVKLADLGLARDPNEEGRLTRDGTTVGTLDYMSPEQARDSGLADIRSDLYSLGVTWYHLLAGQAPFSEGGLGERLYRIMNELPADVREFNPRVSEATAAVLERLLAKKPSRRHQTPDELLRDLKALANGGKPADVPATEAAPAAPSRAARKAARPSTGGTRTGPRSKATAETDTTRPATAVSPSSRRPLWYAVGGTAAALLVAGVVLVLVLRGRHRPDDGAPGPDARVLVQPPPTPDGPPPPQPDPTPGDPPVKKPDPPVPSPTPTPVKTRYPALYTPAAPFDPAALRKEVEAPWAGATPAPADAFVCRVARAPGGGKGPCYPSLAEACAAAPAGKACVIELCDNGPVFEMPVVRSGRDLTIRAGKGYHPLVAWDLPRTLEARRKAPRGAAGPLVLFDLQGGSLTLEGLEIVVQWPEKSSGDVALLRVRDGDLTATDCTFSVSGKHRDGITLARVTGAGVHPARCRFRRCQARGESLVALELDAPGARVLFDGCLVAGGEAPLFQVRADGKRGASVSVVRSTLLAGQTLLRLDAAGGADRGPLFRWLGWDALLARTASTPGGELLQVRGGAAPDGVSWRAVNCLYAGWQTLLAGATTLPAADVGAWRRQWGRSEGDDVRADAWPAVPPANPAEAGAAAYRTAGTPAAFAATLGDDQPLGCDLDALPPARDGWLSLTFEPFVVPPVAVLEDADPPASPPADDDMFHGTRLNLNLIDLGDYLQRARKKWTFAPRVVLHLAGSGERPTTPFRVDGYDLVLYFEPPAGGARPLTLVPSGRSRGAGALVEVAGGSLSVIGGGFRLPNVSGSGQPPVLLHARGGDLRLYRCRLEGPERDLPDSFRRLVAVDGSGDLDPARARVCAINECVLVSGLDGVRVVGVGARVLIRGSLLVAGSDALRVDPGRACRDRANVQCLLDRTTVAARRAVFDLDEAPGAAVPREPVVVQTLDCAFLAPFPDKPARAGLLLYGGDMLTRGLVLWQSERDVYDPRLCFGAARATEALPAKPEGFAPWARLWGTPGVRRPVLTLKLKGVAFQAERWPLDRLTLPPGRGASLGTLGIRPEDKPTKPPIGKPR